MWSGYHANDDDREESSGYFWDTPGEQLAKKRKSRRDEFPENVTQCSVLSCLVEINVKLLYSVKKVELAGETTEPPSLQQFECC